VPRARRLAWLAGAAALAAVVIAAVLALPAVAPPPPASAGSPGSPVRLPPDAAAGPAPPGAPSGSGVEQAAQLVTSARAEVAAGRLAQARDLLSQAYALDPQPATLLELASVDLQAGRCRDARRAVLRVIADGAGALSARAEELMGRIGRCD
jgi:hypothetical protein